MPLVLVHSLALAAEPEIPLKRFATPAFSIMLPEGFQNKAKDPMRLEDSRGTDDSVWLWGVVAAQSGRFSDEDLETFAQGKNCPANMGQVPMHVKKVRTKNLLGFRYSCGSPDGKPYGANPKVSGWMRLQANSPRRDRRYTIHLNFWADPRGEELQKFLDKIVLSFQEKGGPSTVGGKKRLQSTGF